MNTTATITPPAVIRILLVDDHQVVRMGLRSLLEDQEGIEVLGEASTVATAVSEAARLSPNFILLDVRLPDGSGFDACQQIQASGLDARVLILTSVADDETVFQSISVGADGYLLKEIDGEALIQAIRKVASGQSVLDPAVTGRVFSRMKSNSIPGGGDKIDLLSAQERRVLALLSEGKTNKEIANDMGLSDKTVKNYLSNLLGKLQFNRRSQAVAYYVRKSTETPPRS